MTVKLLGSIGLNVDESVSTKSLKRMLCAR